MRLKAHLPMKRTKTVQYKCMAVIRLDYGYAFGGIDERV